MAWNPYFDEWAALHPGNDWRDPTAWLRGTPPAPGRVDAWLRRRIMRDVLIAKYAFAVPSEDALAALAALGPIVEMGAGTGYWTRCLQERGADVIAYDELGPWWGEWFTPRALVDGDDYPRVEKSTGSPVLWTDVRRGGPSALRAHRDRTLLLCWPGYREPMAAQALRAHRSGTVAYVGEGPGGCTGDDAFHDRLERDYDEVACVPIPQWDGLHDRLTIWRRR